MDGAAMLRKRIAVAVVTLAWTVWPAPRGGLPVPVAAASATDADAYLVQIEYAVSKLDVQMSKLTQRASRVDPLTRCSFGKRRREYYIAKENLQGLIARARRSRRNAVALRRKVESAFEGVKQAFGRALACYR